MFPSEFIENNNSTVETEEIGCDFLFDYNTGQHLMENAVLVECNRVESIKQFIQNVLRTQANVYGVYVQDETDVFGISIYEHLGSRTLPTGYLNSELKREVTENLLKHPLITSVTDWKGEVEKRTLHISFTTTLTDGTLIETSENVG